MDEHAAHTPTEKRETTLEDMSGMDEHADHAPMVASSDDAKTIRYWTCVMHPTVKMPEPSNCPVCKMDLIPIYEGSGLELTEQQKALIPIRTEPIAFREPLIFQNSIAAGIAFGIGIIADGVVIREPFGDHIGIAT